MFEIIGRLVDLIPQIFVISSVAIVGFYLSKRFGSSADTPEDRVANWFIELKRFGTNAMIAAPSKEELLFRAPLVIVFGELSPTAWAMILYGAMIFGLMHLNVLHSYLFTKLPATTLRYRIQRALHLTQTSILGVVCGYCGVASHSLWLPVLVHTLWNTGITIVQGICAASEYRRLHEGLELQEIPPGQGFYLHLQHSRSQRAYRTILFESGFSNPIHQGSEFDLLGNNNAPGTKFVVHKIIRTDSSVSVYAMPKI